MRLNYPPIYFVIIPVLLLLISCKQEHSQTEIEAAMNQYDHLIQKMDADSIALLFTPDGNLGDIAKGQDSIRKFLASFKNVKVISTKSITKTIELSGDSSIQKGTYQQVDIIDGKDTVRVKGEFTAKWLWLSEIGWRIKSMKTKSLN